MKKFLKNWIHVILISVWFLMLCVSSIACIISKTEDLLHLWLLGANFGIVTALLISSVQNKIGERKKTNEAE